MGKASTRAAAIRALRKQTGDDGVGSFEDRAIKVWERATDDHGGDHQAAAALAFVLIRSFDSLSAVNSEQAIREIDEVEQDA